jgi:hypothetical protein
MYSTTAIQHFTPAVLRAACQQKGLTVEEFRLGTLKRADVEIRNLLENALLPLHDDDRGVLEDFHLQVRLAIGDE